MPGDSQIGFLYDMENKEAGNRLYYIVTGSEPFGVCVCVLWSMLKLTGQR